MRRLTMRAVVIALGSLASSIAPGTAHATPANDDYAAAQEVFLGGAIRGTTTGATGQGWESSYCEAARTPTGPGGGPMPFTDGLATVWYRLSAQHGDQIRVSVPWASPDVDVQAFVIRDEILVPVSCWAEDAFTLHGDGPVYVRVATFGARDASFELLLGAAPGDPEQRPYVNVDAATATPITLPYTAGVMPEFADRDPPSPTDARLAPPLIEYPAKTDVWYQLRVDEDTLVTVTGWMYSGPPTLQVYEHGDPATPIAEAHTANDDLHGLVDGAHLAVELRAGIDYLVRAARLSGCRCEELWLEVEAAPTLDLSPALQVEADATGGIDITGTVNGHPLPWDSIFSTSPVWVNVTIDPVGELPAFSAGEWEVGHRFSARTILPGCTGSYDVAVRLIARHHRELDPANDAVSVRLHIDDHPAVPACLLASQPLLRL